MAISVLITTLNEEKNLSRCLRSIKKYSNIFDDIVVIDSNSTDKTTEIAMLFNARVETFQWNGQYPKKRQWILNHIKTKNDWVFFLDADEIVTQNFIQALSDIDFSIAGYFVRSRYIFDKQVMQYGLLNNKLALFNRQKIEFPVVNDLVVLEMGEMEGHYQPILKSRYQSEKIKQLKGAIHHDSYSNIDEWKGRHYQYAAWEAYMIQNNCYPKDPVVWRNILKQLFRSFPMRYYIMFFYCYVCKCGFLDGSTGFNFALSRYDYYRLVASFLKTNRLKGK